MANKGDVKYCDLNGIELRTAADGNAIALDGSMYYDFGLLYFEVVWLVWLWFRNIVS